jgi:hypothetical protein
MHSRHREHSAYIQGFIRIVLCVCLSVKLLCISASAWRHKQCYREWEVNLGTCCHSGTALVLLLLSAGLVLEQQFDAGICQ